MQTRHFSSSDLKDHFTKTPHAHAAFMNSFLGSRCAHLIITKNTQGQLNGAIFSSATHLGSDPSLFLLVSRPNTVPRHTLENLKETSYGTLNHIPWHLAEQAHQTSARYPREVNELEACGLETETLSAASSVPFLKGSQAKASFKLKREILLEENGTHLLICQYEDFFISPKISVSEQGAIMYPPKACLQTPGLGLYNTLCETPPQALPYAKV